MRFSTLSHFAALVITGLAGCAAPTQDSGLDKPKAPDTAAPDKTVKSTSAPEEKPVDKGVPVPAPLQSEGYYYMGLNRPGKLTYNFTQDGVKKEDGTITLSGAVSEKGTIIYTREREGGMATMGTDTLELRPDGIFVTQMSTLTLDKPSLEMPAEIPIGKTWDETGSFKYGEKDVTQKTTYKIAREEKLKTPAGEFDCKVVETSGTLTLEKNVSHLSGSMWFAKDIGLVKMTMKVSQKLKDGDKNQSSEFVLAQK